MLKKEYRQQIIQEQSFYDTSFRARVLKYDSFYIGKYLKSLRWAEWYDMKTGILSKMQCAVYKYRLRKFGKMFGFQIGLHTCGFGLRFYHWGTIIINKNAKIGRGGVIYPGVTIGQTSHGKVPVIGDNVFIGLGAKVFGDIKIGNNVIIAPNAIVVKDVPDNAVVGGIPAKVIKFVE